MALNRTLTGRYNCLVHKLNFSVLRILEKTIRFFTITFLIACLLNIYGCSKPKDPVFCSWRIEMPSKNNPFLKDAHELVIKPESILFRNHDVSRTYPIILNENHMVIQTETAKYLMILEKPNDTTLVLREKYTKNPCVFYLKK